MTRPCVRCGRSIGATTRVCPACAGEVRRKWPRQWPLRNTPLPHVPPMVPDLFSEAGISWRSGNRGSITVASLHPNGQPSYNPSGSVPVTWGDVDESSLREYLPRAFERSIDELIRSALPAFAASDRDHESRGFVRDAIAGWLYELTGDMP